MDIVAGMITAIAALLYVAVTGYLRFRYDRLGVERELKYIIFCWLCLTSWSEGRWAKKGVLFGVWLSSCLYRGHQRRRQAREALELDVQKSKKALSYVFARDGSLFENHDDFTRSRVHPVMYPCRTSHTRLFPKNHSFSYSYLFVAVPVGWQGHISDFLSIDLKTLPWSQDRPKNCWFDVDSSDYLARGENMHGLRGKLDDYLESQVGLVSEAFLIILTKLRRTRKLKIIPLRILSLHLDSLATLSIRCLSGISTMKKKSLPR